MARQLLDANVFLRHLVGDHADHSPRSSALFARIERGELAVRIADTVVFETVLTLQSHYARPRPEIRDAVLPLIELPGVILPRKHRWRTAFDLYVSTKLSLAGAFHVALMTDLGLDAIITFDRGFDKIAGITRIEP